MTNVAITHYGVYRVYGKHERLIVSYTTEGEAQKSCDYLNGQSMTDYIVKPLDIFISFIKPE